MVVHRDVQNSQLETFVRPQIQEVSREQNFVDKHIIITHVVRVNLRSLLEKDF